MVEVCEKKNVRDLARVSTIMGKPYWQQKNPSIKKATKKRREKENNSNAFNIGRINSTK